MSQNKVSGEYCWIEDPGHAWLRAPIKEVRESKAEISSYSYISEETGLAYLEEDCDAGAFLLAVGKLKDEDGNFIKYSSQYQENTFVRNLPSFA